MHASKQAESLLYSYACALFSFLFSPYLSRGNVAVCALRDSQIFLVNRPVLSLSGFQNLPARLFGMLSAFARPFVFNEVSLGGSAG